MTKRIDSTNCTHDAALARIAELESKLKAADEAWHEQEDELQSLRVKLETTGAEVDAAGEHAANQAAIIQGLQSRLDECRESCARAVAARDVATAKLEECLDLIADAIANHESGARCDMDLARAAVVLARNESVVERQETK